jgi:phytoene dehydrogenase-like protein
MSLDVVVVGSGPNGLAAALTLSRAGRRVRLIEGDETPGGGCRTEERTLPGFHHDICSSVHPLAAASPFFKRARLSGLDLVGGRVAFAHPIDGGRAGAVVGSVDETAATLGADGPAYRRLMGPLVTDVDRVLPAVLAPLRRPPPAADLAAMARYGALGLQPISLLVRRFRSDEARGLLAGVGAHASRPLSAPITGGFGLLLTMLAHDVGWPVVAGGSARIVDALWSELAAAGVELETGRWVRSLRPLAEARSILLDCSADQLLTLDGLHLPTGYRRALRRFRFGPGVCKVDWALAGPVPWTAPVCREAATVHVGGTFEEVAASEAAVAGGRHPERPFCIVVQAGVVDPSRAPAGHQTLWAYCHVPPGSDVDMTAAIESQIERFAPGFKDLVLARATTTAVGMERHNPNYVGGDIASGAGTLRQTLGRPTLLRRPYRTPVPGLYLCSSSTPPGGGVHGMCGEGAARAVLADQP